MRNEAIQAVLDRYPRLIEPWVQAVFDENRDRPREGFDLGAADYPFRQPFAVADTQEVFVSPDPGGDVRGIMLGELLLR